MDSLKTNSIYMRLGCCERKDLWKLGICNKACHATVANIHSLGTIENVELQYNGWWDDHFFNNIKYVFMSSSTMYKVLYHDLKQSKQYSTTFGITYVSSTHSIG